jgi:hypothetical protein
MSLPPAFAGMENGIGEIITVRFSAAYLLRIEVNDL